MMSYSYNFQPPGVGVLYPLALQQYRNIFNFFKYAKMSTCARSYISCQSYIFLFIGHVHVMIPYVRKKGFPPQYGLKIC